MLHPDTHGRRRQATPLNSIRTDLVDVYFRDGTRLGRLDDLRQRRDEAFENRLLMLLTLGRVLVQEDGQVLFEVDRRRVEPEQEKAREQTT